MIKHPIVKTITKTVIETEIIKVEVPVEVVKEVIIKEVEVVEKIVEVEPSYCYEVSDTERESIARILYREAGHSSWDTQCAVVSVILNRLKSPYWKNEIASVLSAPGQFSTYKLIKNTTPTEENYSVVDFVLKNGPTIPKYVLYFRSSYHFKWSGYHGYCTYGNLYFGYTEKDLKSYENWD